MKKLLYLALSTFFLFSCGSSEPSDEDLFEQTLNPEPPISLPAVSLLSSAPPPEEFNDYISIMGQNGAVITMWSVDRRSWLWMYPPLNSQDFGKLRNWRIPAMS